LLHFSHAVSPLLTNKVEQQPWLIKAIAAAQSRGMSGLAAPNSIRASAPAQAPRAKSAVKKKTAAVLCRGPRNKNNVSLVLPRSPIMAKYGKAAGKSVKRAMHKKKKGTLKSGRSKKKVKSRKQAIAIGLSEARKKGAKVPRKKKGGRKKKSR
jgi:hypothetical protein